MHNKCCIVNCVSRRKDVHLFSFPSNEIRLKKWLLFIKCVRLGSLSVQDLRKQFVCQKHFEKRFFSPTSVRARLRVGAYPTLFTDNEINSGIPQIPPTTDDSNADKIQNLEHNYFKKRCHEDHNYCKVNVPEKRMRTETDMKCNPSASVPYEIDGNLTFLNTPSTSVFEESTVEVRDTSAVTNCTPRSTKRKHVIFKQKALSPNCAKLYREYKKSRRQLNFSQRARRAIKFSQENSFKKMTENMNPLAKKIMWMQIKQCTRKAKGRRFSNEEKLIALSIMKQSPKCYRFLHKIFILPSKYTLNKIISSLKIEPGISSQVFAAMKLEVNTWETNKKYCSLLFDEISLEPSLNYDKHKDVITGFVDLNDRTNDFADHALVFMLRGAIYKWQQPLAFYFCKGATPKVHMKNIIKDVIAAVSDTGLLPVALICDQGTAFQSALKSLQEDTRKAQITAGEKIDDVIVINGHTLSVIHDPPHLIKGLRNNFITKNIKFNNKISKWNDLVEVYKTDCNHAQMRLLHKLNDEHIIPEKIKKMKVKNCTRVFSKTMAATLLYTAQFSQYADGNKVSETLENTAEVVSFFDELFDSVNGTVKTQRENP